MLYTLIIWSSLCTSADPACETGDYLLFNEYSSLRACEAVLAAWIVSAPETHYGACYKPSKKRKT